MLRTTGLKTSAFCVVVYLLFVLRCKTVIILEKYRYSLSKRKAWEISSGFSPATFANWCRTWGSRSSTYRWCWSWAAQFVHEDMPDMQYFHVVAVQFANLMLLHSYVLSSMTFAVTIIKPTCTSHSKKMKESVEGICQSLFFLAFCSASKICVEGQCEKM